VHCLCLSPDNARLYSGGKDGAVRAWDHLEGGRCTLTMSGHTAAVCALAADPGGARLYSAGLDNTVR
jgi:WD40 repeat protein